MLKFQKKNYAILGIFFAHMVSKTLKETNFRLIDGNSLFVNHITPFEI